jgi:iron complex outermembrane receptor protein
MIRSESEAFFRRLCGGRKYALDLRHLAKEPGSSRAPIADQRWNPKRPFPGQRIMTSKMRAQCSPAVLTLALSAALAGLPRIAGAQLELLAATGILEEVTVTAQRRKENVQDVPIAMRVLSGRELLSRGIGALADVPATISNVQVINPDGTGQTIWVIRGVGLDDYNPNNTPTASVYIDEVYQVSNVISSVALFDVDRIEVLKGPQSGLYGRNTSGGAVRVLSRAPSNDTTDGYANLAISDLGRVDLEGAFGGPISDHWASRIAGRMSQGGAWQTSIADRRKYGNADRWDLRGQSLWTGVDGDAIRVIAATGRDTSQGPLNGSLGVYDPNTGSLCASLLAGRRDNQSCVSLRGLTDLQLTGRDSAPLTLQSDNGDYVLSNALAKLDNTYASLTGIVDLNVGPVAFQSISGYIDFDYRHVVDEDGDTREFGHQDATTKFTVLSQEFRVQSRSSAESNWQAGAAYTRDELAESRLFLFRQNPLVVFGALGLPSLADGIARVTYGQPTESWAVYAQGEHRVDSAWRVRVALRYTDETKHYVNGALELPTLGAAGERLTDVNRSERLHSRLSGSVGADYRPASNRMLYATVTKGFKSGGFFGGFPTDSADQVNPYREEVVYAYEAGSKLSVPEARLVVNGAVFFYDYRDAQGLASVYSPLTRTNHSALTNIGNARHYGLDLDVAIEPLRGLRLTGSIGYLEAKIVGSELTLRTDDGVPYSLAGQQRSAAPRFSGTVAADYEKQLPAGLAGAIHVDVNSRSTITADFGSPFDTATGERPGYTVANCRLSLQDHRQKWTTGVLARNCLDKRYVTDRGGDGLGSYREMYGQRREIGLSFTIAL